MNKGKMFRILTGICFVIYLFFLIKLIIFKNPLEQTMEVVNGWSVEAVKAHLETANFTPFHTIRLYLRYWDRLGTIAFENLVYNVVAFVPFGIAQPILLNRKNTFLLTFLAGTLLSAAIEGTQLVTLLGECDVDDVILNAAGVLIGWGMYWVGSRIYRTWFG